MARITEGECPIAVRAFITKQAKERGVSLTQAVKDYAEEAGTPYGTVERWVWPRKRAVKSDGRDKPLRKHTKPEVKCQLDNVRAEIKAGNISNDDVKALDSTMATAIKDGVVSERVGTATSSAVITRNKRKYKPEPKPKEVDNFKRLNRHMKVAIDGMTAWADGAMVPETEDEAADAKAILAKGANFIIQFARLGIDIEGVQNTFLKGGHEHGKTNEHNQTRLISG